MAYAAAIKNKHEGEEDLNYMSMEGDAVDNGSPYFPRLFDREAAFEVYGKNKRAVDKVFDVVCLNKDP